MRVMITGDKGFIGRHFRRRLESQGHEVYGVDIKDPTDPRDCRDMFRADSETHFDLVIHCAAIVGGRQTIEGQPLSVAVDLSIDAELFQWMLKSRPSHTVYFSSSAAYPVSLQRRGIEHRLCEDDIDLDDVRTPDLTYGWSKLTGEQLAKYAEAEGVRVHVIRPFSGYGEDQDLDYPFPSFIDRAKRLVDPFTVWGDGTQTRDFIHVEDIVSATLKAVEVDVPGPINLGWGRATSFNELSELVCREAGYKVRLDHNLGAPQGVHWRVADNRKLRDFFEPRISLEEGIALALRSAAKAA